MELARQRKKEKINQAEGTACPHALLNSVCTWRTGDQWSRELLTGDQEVSGFSQPDLQPTEEGTLT